MTDPGTAQELLILNSVLYFPRDTLPQRGDTLADWAQALSQNPARLQQVIDSSPGKMNAEEVKGLLYTISSNRNIYGQVTMHDRPGSRVDNTYDEQDKTSPVVNATFTDHGKPIVVFKGTSGAAEWRDNGEGGYANVTDTVSQQDALTYYNRIMAGFPGQTALVSGHSKGGNKAQYVGILGDSVDSVYSFDGQGFNAAFYLKYASQVQQNAGKITSISNQYDYVNILFTAVPGSEQQYTNSPFFNATSYESFLRWHSPGTMFTAAGAGLFLDLSDAKSSPSELMGGVDDFLGFAQAYMNKDDFAYLCYLAMSQMMGGQGGAYGKVIDKPEGFDERFKGILKNYLDTKGVDPADLFWWSTGLFTFAGTALGHPEAGAVGGVAAGSWLAWELSQAKSPGYNTVPRDFRDEVKQRLLALVSEVEAEPWWDITKWDVWYRIDKDVLGGVDFASDEGERREYYRKMIDMNGTSRAQIERIFSDVNAADRTFASEMNTWTSDARSCLHSLNEIAGKVHG